MFRSPVWSLFILSSQSLSMYLPSAVRSTCPTHLTHDFTTLTTLGREYVLWSFSLWIFLQAPVTASAFSTSIPLNSSFPSRSCRDASSHPYKILKNVLVHGFCTMAVHPPRQISFIRQFGRNVRTCCGTLIALARYFSIVDCSHR